MRHIVIKIFTVLVALVVLNFLASRHHGRLDLTERSLYTLSPSTENILEHLDDVLTVRVYFSYDLPPALMPLKRGVDDLIAEFKSVAGNRIQVEYIDPAATVLDEQRIMSFGIVPVQVNVIERDRREVAKVFIGMAILHGDRMEVIPVVQNLANLEYRLAQSIIKVSSVEDVTVGWWGATGTDKVGGGYEALLRVLEQRYEIKRVGEENVEDMSAEVLSALIIAAPDKVSDAGLFAIDQYLMGGGKLLVLVDRWEIGDDMTAAPKETNVVDLLERYGVTVDDDLVMDRSNALASFAGALLTYHLPYPLWPQVRRDGFSPKDPITAELSSLVLPWTSSIALSDAVGTRAEVLARTTAMAMVTTGENPRLDPESVGKLLERKSGAASYPLVVRVAGPFASAFGDNSFAPPPGRTVVDRSVNEAGLVVVGSARFAQDYFLNLFSSNLAFIENAVDVFAMGDALVGIRSRVGINRPLAILSDAMISTLRIGNVLIGPVLVLLIGAGVFLIRRWRLK